MKLIKAVMFGPSVLALVLALQTSATAAELRTETLQAWKTYVSEKESSITATSKSSVGFLHIDENPKEALAAEHGEILVKPLIRGGSKAVPQGLLHDWVGTAFIPDTSIESVMSVTRDYGHYERFFNPTVTASSVIRRSAEVDEYSVVWATKIMFVSAGVETKCKSHYVFLDDARIYQTSYTTKVQEIEDYGKSDQRLLPSDHGNGFIWRLYTLSRYEARNGGVFIEVEVIALTRDIPGSVHFVVAPLVKKISRNSLRLTLAQTRQAVLSSAGSYRVASNHPGSSNMHMHTVDRVKSFLDRNAQ